MHAGIVVLEDEVIGGPGGEAEEDGEEAQIGPPEQAPDQGRRAEGHARGREEEAEEERGVAARGEGGDGAGEVDREEGNR